MGGAAGASGAGAAGAAGCVVSAPSGGDAWRSKLFPKDWRPVHAGGTRDAAGLALPDFSYAGYHRGDGLPPIGAGSVATTVPAALGDGKTDATSALQGAIDATCAAGGGVVRLPAGTYRLTMLAGKTAAITISCSGLVLRGDGPTTRLLFDDAADARAKSVLSIGAGGSLLDGATTKTYALAVDAPETTRTLTLTSTAGLAVGDAIVVRADVTDAFRADHRMDEPTSGLVGLWPDTQYRGVLLPRAITAVTGSTITLDAPTQYPLKTRDAARVYAQPKVVAEVGIEALSMGMVESKAPSTSATDEAANDDDYTIAGRMGYEVHASSLISFGVVRDSWLADVTTFAPQGNATGAHVLSLGVSTGGGAHRLHVERTTIGRPQYRGGGGNGYAFALQGHDSLFVDSRSEHARHGFTLNNGVSGNVLLRLTMFAGRYSNDTHRFLSHANLFDGIVLDDAWMQSVNRGTTSGGAGFTGTRLVFWNPLVKKNHTSAKGCAVESAQFADGYLIGSRSEPGATAKLCPESFTNGTWKLLDPGLPVDFVEGEEQGGSLDPTSLYEAQRAMRAARDGTPCP